MADAKRQKSRQAEVKVKLKEPSMYNVVMLNDDVTTMDFVVEVLKEIFNKDSETAVALMLKVHHEGEAVVAKYTYDIASTKRRLAIEKARTAGFPFQMRLDEA